MFMTTMRPNPDHLLAEVAAAEKKSSRGKLKIFFGSNAGVGKTFAMLDEARKRATEGAKVLIGYAEPHIRPETEALLLGLDILPYKLIEHKGATLKEFDIDAALAARPDLLCVDELAHTNCPGTRHPKRWQDVDELLTAGINVYTTLNVQHLESVNDIVERITGIVVRETLPDRIFEEADEVELVDISPDELTERLREGKIYKPEQAERALKNFFNRGNLIALRELALRKTAERVDAQMQEARRASASTQVWAASEKLLVCVGPSPFAAQLVRTTKRLAAALHANWYAVSVENPGQAMSETSRARLTETLHLAEQLGAQAVTLSGHNVADELLTFARQKNITKIVVGKPELPRWREWICGSIVDDLIHRSGAIDIYVIRHEGAKSGGVEHPKPVEKAFDPKPYVYAGVICFLATLIGAFVYHVLGDHGRRFSNTNALMIDLLAVLFIATRFGRGPAIAASLFSVAAFDFTVVPPYYTFSVSDSQYIFTFGVMLVVAILISALADRIRRQADGARDRERRTAALLQLGRDIAATRERAEIVTAVARHVAEVFDSPAAIFLPNKKAELALAGVSREMEPLDEKELGVIRWVFDHSQAAGRGTVTLPSAGGVYLPMVATGGTVGVLGLVEPRGMADPERLHLLEAFANQSAVALERASLADESRQAWERVEAEFLRNTLLSGVSHDLRTPLATITGAASSLCESTLPDQDRRELAAEIVSESERMERLIANLLDMTRLESGGFPLKKEWHSIDEIVGSAIRSVRKRLANRSVRTHLPANLPLIHVDALALEQAVANLVDNAVNYTPAESPIEISASLTGEQLVLSVADKGPGLPAEDPGRVFQRFFRGSHAGTNGRPDGGGRRGAGLGLAICKGIIELHGGTITAENRPTGGALFRITLPTGGKPPAIPAEEEPHITP